MGLKRLPFTQEALAKWTKAALSASAHAISDGLACFRALTAADLTHEPIATGGGAQCVKMEQSHAVNTFLGNLKTAYSGTYHAFDFEKYAERYLGQVPYFLSPLRLAGHPETPARGGSPNHRPS